MIVPDLSAVVLAASKDRYVSAAASTLLLALRWFPAVDDAMRECVCAGISAAVRVTVSAPLLCASGCPSPLCNGVLDRRSGRAKLVRPSPP